VNAVWVREKFRSLLLPPRIPELLFAAVLVWLFATGDGWSVLLADGDTGWHIRNGEQILDTGTVPRTDAFGFGSEGRPWYAWEWLTDVVFALLFRTGGLRAVAVFCGLVIAASVSVVFRRMTTRSVGVAVALPITLLAVGASSVHYLARPHVLGLLFFVSLCWILDTGRGLAIVPPLFVLWTNCHGSFLAGLAMLSLWCFTSRRFVIVASSVAATFCNPYGWRLHAHAIEYLRSSWIQATVEEFESPRFRSESMLQFEILLLLGLMTLPWLLRRREFYPAAAVVLWAHESLTSVRHVPLYCAAVAPYLASWLQGHWVALRRTSRPDSVFATFAAIEEAWSPWTRGATAWPVLLCFAFAGTWSPPLSFPANKFPVKLVERNTAAFTEAASQPPRVFSSDQWCDYLTFRLYPHVRIYFDGRSDFFGPWRGKAYQQLMAGKPGAASILDREFVHVAVIPKDWPLAGILLGERGWRVADSDELGIVFVRDPNQSSHASR
jgi:hypothetical protein